MLESDPSEAELRGVRGSFGTDPVIPRVAERRIDEPVRDAGGRFVCLQDGPNGNSGARIIGTFESLAPPGSAFRSIVALLPVTVMSRIVGRGTASDDIARPCRRYEPQAVDHDRELAADPGTL